MMTRSHGKERKASNFFFFFSSPGLPRWSWWMLITKTCAAPKKAAAVFSFKCFISNVFTFMPCLTWAPSMTSFCSGNQASLSFVQTWMAPFDPEAVTMSVGPGCWLGGKTPPP